ncbi:hypothetical protein [Streptomyces nigra]|uniref:Uncharacterized protein n=1 Tax=Streptomyces nigra TaxID=1827580 RepID=A0ABZ1IXR8_9ACTN
MSRPLVDTDQELCAAIAAFDSAPAGELTENGADPDPALPDGDSGNGLIRPAD